MAFRPEYRWMGAVFAVVGAGWFLIEVSVFLPHFSRHALIHWDRYDNLGPDFHSALYNLASNPLFLVTEALIRNNKYYYLIALLLSVGFLPLFAWREATLITLPALMMLLSGNGGHYKFGFHYSAAVLPFLFYSAAHGLSRFPGMMEKALSVTKANRTITSVLLVFLLANIYQVKWSRLTHIDGGHVRVIEEVLHNIPAQASLRAEGNVVAMLSSRHQIAPIDDETDGNFSWWKPEYVLLDFKHVEENPVQSVARKNLSEALVHGGQYRIVAQQDGVVLFRRVVP